MARERLDKLLVDRGLAASRERARALIMAGKVLGRRPAGDQGRARWSTPTPRIALREEDHPVRLARRAQAGEGARRVRDRSDRPGRARHRRVDRRLHRRAAAARRDAKVYAIDVGYGQLAWSLRQDPRVVVLERENVPRHGPRAGARAVRPRGDRRLVHLADAGAAARRASCCGRRRASRSSRWSSRSSRSAASTSARAAWCATRPRGAAPSTRCATGPRAQRLRRRRRRRVADHRPGRQRRVPAAAPHRRSVTTGRRRARSRRSRRSRCSSRRGRADFLYDVVVRRAHVNRPSATLP